VIAVGGLRQVRATFFIRFHRLIEATNWVADDDGGGYRELSNQITGG
jgi:hypothetical protein